MALQVIKFYNRDDMVYDETNIGFVEGTAKLRRTDGSGNYSREGTYTSDSIVTEEVIANDVIKYIGFQVAVDIPTGTSIEYQVSVDGGTNWKYWDGSTWTVTTSNKNTPQEINEGIEFLKFELGDQKRIRFKVFLNTNADQDKTPSIKYILLSSEMRFSYSEDVKRSLIIYIRDNLQFDTHATMRGNGTKSYTLSDNYSIEKVLGIYNYSKDPYKTNSILDSVDQSDESIVTLTESVGTDEFLIFHYTAKVKNFVAFHPDSYLNKSKMPLVAIDNNFSQINHRYQYSGGESTYIPKDKEFRISEMPEYMMSDFRVYFVTNNSTESTRMLDEAEELLDMRSTFKSVGSGYTYVITSYNYQFSRVDAKEEVYGQMVRLGVAGKNFSDKFETVPRLEKINLAIGDFENVYSSAIVE